LARVIWSPQALADLEVIGDYFAREAPAYAQSFVDGAFETVEQLSTFPRMGRSLPEINDPELRELIYRGYRLIHIVTGQTGDEEVRILSVYPTLRQFGGNG
jgi:toxin ParE1/3/4